MPQGGASSFFAEKISGERKGLCPVREKESAGERESICPVRKRNQPVREKRQSAEEKESAGKRDACRKKEIGR